MLKFNLKYYLQNSATGKIYNSVIPHFFPNFKPDISIRKFNKIISEKLLQFLKKYIQEISLFNLVSS